MTATVYALLGVLIGLMLIVYSRRCYKEAKT
jgi:hypothetical protein